MSRRSTTDSFTIPRMSLGTAIFSGMGIGLLGAALYVPSSCSPPPAFASSPKSSRSLPLMSIKANTVPFPQRSMAVSQNAEQLLITNRPASYVPGHTLEKLLGFIPRPDSEIFHLNMAMHYGEGAVAGGIRGLMSFYGIRGPFADFIFTGIRLLIDQSLENWTGVGAPPWYVCILNPLVHCLWIYLEDITWMVIPLLTCECDDVGLGQSRSRCSTSSTRPCLLSRPGT